MGSLKVLIRFKSLTYIGINAHGLMNNYTTGALNYLHILFLLVVKTITPHMLKLLQFIDAHCSLIKFKS